MRFARWRWRWSSSRLDSLWRSALFLGLLLSSKAFVDYTSSGLEYPLSFFLLAVFYCRFLAVARNRRERLAPTRLVGLGLIASLAFLNRSDSILLYLGPLALSRLRSHGRCTARGSLRCSRSRWRRSRCGWCSRTSTTAFRFPIPITRRWRPASREACSFGKGWRTSPTASISIRSRSGLIALAAAVAVRAAPAAGNRRRRFRAACTCCTRFRSAAIS